MFDYLCEKFLAPAEAMGLLCAPKGAWGLNKTTLNMIDSPNEMNKLQIFFTNFAYLIQNKPIQLLSTYGDFSWASFKFETLKSKPA